MLNTLIPTSEFKNLKFEFVNGEYIVSLIDKEGFEIIKGYGISIIEAINDLHHNLL